MVVADGDREAAEVGADDADDGVVALVVVAVDGQVGALARVHGLVDHVSSLLKQRKDATLLNYPT